MGLSSVVTFLPFLICLFQSYACGYLVQGHAFPVILPHKYNPSRPGFQTEVRHRYDHQSLNIHGGIPYSGSQKVARGEIQGKFKGGLFREKYWSKKFAGTLQKQIPEGVIKGHRSGRKTMYKGTVVGKYNGGVYSGVYKGYYRLSFFHGVLKPKGVVLRKFSHKSREPNFTYKRILKLFRGGKYRTHYRPATRGSLQREAPGTASRKRYLAMKRFLTRLNKPGYTYNKIALSKRKNAKSRHRILIKLYKHKLVTKPRYVKSHGKIHVHKIMTMTQRKNAKSRHSMLIKSYKHKAVKKPRFVKSHKKIRAHKIKAMSKRKNAKSRHNIHSYKHKKLTKPTYAKSQKKMRVHKNMHGTLSRKRFIERFMKKLKKLRHVQKKNKMARIIRGNGKGVPVFKGVYIYKGIPRYKGAHEYRGVPIIKGAREYRGVPIIKGARKYRGVPIIKGARKYRGVPIIKGAREYRGVPIIKGARKYRGVPIIKGAREYRGVPIIKGAREYRGVPVHAYKGVGGKSSRERFIKRFLKTLKNPHYTDKISHN